MHSSLKTALARLQNGLLNLDWRIILTLIAPLTICIASIVSVGPEVQKHVFSALSSDAPSLYQAVNQQHIPVFPTLLEWLGQIFAVPCVLIGIVGAIAARRAPNLKASIVAIALSTVAIYSIFDIFIVYTSGDATANALLSNFAGNLLGGILASLLVAAALISFKYVREVAGGGVTLALLMASATLILSGLLVSTIAFYIVSFVFRPLPSEVEVVAERPIKGAYASDRTRKWVWDRDAKEAEKESTTAFSVLPNQPVDGAMEMTAPSGDQRVVWTRAKNTYRYRADIWFYVDCPFTDPKALPRAAPTLTEIDVQDLRIATKGPHTLLKLHPEGAATFAFVPENISMFWLYKDGGKGQSKASLFVSPKDEMNISSTDGLLLSMGALLFTRETPSDNLSPYVVSLKLNGTNRQILLPKAVRYRPNADLTCHPLDSVARSQIAKHQSSSTPLKLFGGGTVFTVLIKITPKPGDSEFISRVSNRLSFKGFNGWGSLAGLNPEDLERTSFGELDMLEFVHGVTSLKVDGAPIDIKTDDHLIMLGEFQGRYLTGARLQVTGKSFATWKSRRRLNLTKWERVPDDWKIWFIGALGAFSLAAARLLWLQLRKLHAENVSHWAR